MRAGGLAALRAALLLAGCVAEPVRIGSKTFTENRILAEMFAILLEEDGVPVKRQTAIGPTPVVFEALKNGAIDVYPEYTGTGLSLVGAPSIADRDRAYDVVSESFAPLGLRFLDRLGFETGFTVVTRPRVARTLSLRRVQDLTDAASTLRLGVTQSFADRPRDGLQPFLDRFGLDFDAIEIFPDAPRNDLYDALLEERVDVIIGFSTDPELIDYRLTLLADEESFFPAYEAAPLVAASLLERRPEVEDVLNQLSGRLDTTTMRALKTAVRIDGQPLRVVARRALYELGLVEDPPRELVPQLSIATEPQTVGTLPANRILSAVRRAMRGRDVDLVETPTPLDTVLSRDARMAIVPAISMFALDDGRVVRDERFEALAAVGSTFVHTLTRADETLRVDFTGTIATGPEGSASHRLATIVAATRDTDTAIVALERSDAETAAAALVEGRADVAVVLAQLGRRDLRAALNSGEVHLVSAAGWWEGAARLSVPFLREARISADAYAGVERAVPTLAMQLVLVGPSASERFVIGQQGPSTFSDHLRPVSGDVVTAIDANLGRHASVDPYLRRSSALVPSVRLPDERVNPNPDRAILTVAILAFVTWAGWLLFRPYTRPHS